MIATMHFKRRGNSSELHSYTDADVSLSLKNRPENYFRRTRNERRESRNGELRKSVRIRVLYVVESSLLVARLALLRAYSGTVEGGRGRENRRKNRERRER